MPLPEQEEGEGEEEGQERGREGEEEKERVRKRWERGEGRGIVNRVGWGEVGMHLNSCYMWMACRGTAADTGGYGPVLFTKRRGEHHA